MRLRNSDNRFIHPISKRRRHALLLEALERRDLFAGDFRTIDGTNNNQSHPDWGSAGVDLLRRAAAAYIDGKSKPISDVPATAGDPVRPSARAVSNALADQVSEETNDRYLSAFIYAWGQFLDHDLDLTPSASPAEPFNINVPADDRFFDPSVPITLNRSKFDPLTGSGVDNPRQQVNVITAFIDASQVYGSDAVRAAALRTMSGGRLKIGDDGLLPLNTDLLPNANDAHRVADDKLFLAGDVRANENIELSAMHTLFVREHNRLADRIHANQPLLTDDEIYQRARRIVAAEMQAITYNEFLPALLGEYALKPYWGYKANVNPGIANEFSTAAFRVGHTMLDDDVEFMDNNGAPIRDEVMLSEAFFNPDLLKETGIDPVLKYLGSTDAQEIDNQVVDSVRNFLFGDPRAGGLDLASLNIQRGRDHGLADYNTTRAAYGLPRVTTFDQITSNTDVQTQLEKVYGNVNNVDLWVGGLAEDHVRGASVGPLFKQIIADQFQRLRDGDRFWYQRDLSFRELFEVERTTLADIVRRNTGITNIQDNLFVFNATISGRVFLDLNVDGLLNRLERGLGGISVELLDADGAVMATTTTARNGAYRFSGLEIGSYQVRVVLREGLKQTSAEPAESVVTRGMAFNGVNFGVALSGFRPFCGDLSSLLDPGGVDEVLTHAVLWRIRFHRR